MLLVIRGGGIYSVTLYLFCDSNPLSQSTALEKHAQRRFFNAFESNDRVCLGSLFDFRVLAQVFHFLFDSLLQNGNEQVYQELYSSGNEIWITSLDLTETYFHTSHLPKELDIVKSALYPDLH